MKPLTIFSKPPKKEHVTTRFIQLI